MAKKLYDEKKIQFIAEKIRINSETTKRYKVSEMPEGIDEVYNKGYDVGHTAGYDDGFASGLEEGRKGEYQISHSFYLPEYGSSGKKDCVGKGVGTWATLSSGYSLYGYALEPCMQLRFSGAALLGSGNNRSNMNVFFVTGYSEGGSGTGVIPCDQVLVTPANSTPGSALFVEYVVEVPQGLGIDGVFFSCQSGGTPSLVYSLGTFPEGYNNGYGNGHEVGYSEGREEGYTEGHEAGYAEGLEDGKAQGGGSGDVEEGIDVSTSFAVSCGDKWYCPPEGKDATTFMMMSTDTTNMFTAYFNWNAISGKRYRAVFKPMNPANLWESFVFAKNDYCSLAVVANDESVGQYVTKINETTFEFTIPPDCQLVFLNGYIQYGCRVYELE